MRLEINHFNIFLIVFVTFIASYFLVYLMRIIAPYFDFLDKPNSSRKIHSKPIPTLGGVGIFLSFLLGYMFFANENTLMISILIASFIILLLGIFDDIKPIPAKYKILVHILIASIIVFYGGLTLDRAEMFGYALEFKKLAPIISVIIIVATINAINLIDGMDGLCAGISSIYFLTIAIISVVLNKMGGLDVVLSLIMLGSTLGFLVHNFPPAKIFMGDTGSTFLGLMISIIALLGFKTLTLTSLVIPLLILTFPIMDTLFAIIRRRLKGKPISEADRDHLHHQLLKLKFSKRTSVLIIYFIDMIFSLTSILYSLGYRDEMVVCYIFIVFMVLFLIFKTDILFEHKKGKDKIKNEC